MLAFLRYCALHGFYRFDLCWPQLNSTKIDTRYCAQYYIWGQSKVAFLRYCVIRSIHILISAYLCPWHKRAKSFLYSICDTYMHTKCEISPCLCSSDMVFTSNELTKQTQATMTTCLQTSSKPDLMISHVRPKIYPHVAVEHRIHLESNHWILKA